VWRFGHFSGYGLPVAGVLRHYARGEGRPHARPPTRGNVVSS
jgi:hypothetical protein